MPGPHQNRTTPGIILSCAGNREQNEHVTLLAIKSSGMGWESLRFKGFVTGFG